MTTIIQGSLIAGIPLLLAALGGIIAERAGVLNVALEGLMLVGAFTAAWVGSGSGDITACAAAIAAGLLAGIVLGWIMVILRADQVVVGIAFNIFALGLTNYLYTVVSGSGLNSLSVSGTHQTRIPGLAGIPWLGPFFSVHWIGYLTYIAIPILLYVLFGTGLGVRVRACGEYAEGARAVGINVVRVRVAAMAVSGVFAAVAGAWLVLGDVGVFRENMTAGRGYLALAIIIIGRWNPLGALVAAGLFAIAEALTFYLQVRGVGIPVEAVLAMPYLIGLVGIAIFGRGVRAPAEDGKPLYLSS